MRSAPRLGFTVVVALAASIAAVRPVRADDSFETVAAAAERVRAIDDVVWALVAPCDRGDDTERRSCRQVRDAAATRLAGKTLLVTADAGAFRVSAWDAKKRSVAVTVEGCIRCGGVSIDGASWLVTGDPGAPAIEAGKARPALLLETARTFKDEDAAKAWAAAVASARVELIVKVGPTPVWHQAGKDGVALEAIGYRVTTLCDGLVIAASPPSGSVPPDKKSCAKKTSSS